MVKIYLHPENEIPFFSNGNNQTAPERTLEKKRTKVHKIIINENYWYIVLFFVVQFVHNHI